MDLFPVFLDLDSRDCLVVGGGKVAARKVGLLRRAGARVELVAPEVCSELRELAAEQGIVHRARTFQAGDLDNKVLIIAATNRDLAQAGDQELAADDDRGNDREINLRVALDDQNQGHGNHELVRHRVEKRAEG